MKKQSFITILLIALMSMAGAKSFAHDIEVANKEGVTIYYVWNYNHTELSVSYKGSRYDTYSDEYSDDVVIPESVVYKGNTYTVTSIGSEAFSDCWGLNSVTIPNSVTSISSEAFFGCYNLTTLAIPNGVASIGEGAFSGCDGLTSIKVESGNMTYDSRNNCNAIIEKSSNTLIAGCKNTTIPNSVTSIGDNAFNCCYYLTSVTIPNSVTSIGERAFNNCRGLTSVTIPNSVTSIGEDAFRFCSGLTSVTIPNSVTSIGTEAFFGCSGLTSINIPISVTSIGKSAFEFCSGLISVAIPPNMTSIDNFAFDGCSGLEDFYCWAENVPTTDIYAFDRIPFLSASLHVPAASLDAYKNTYPWSQFGKIVALEGQYILGDVTGNGTVDDEDIAFVLNCIMDDIFNTKADINQDNKVNVSDLVDIVNIMNNSAQ